MWGAIETMFRHWKWFVLYCHRSPGEEGSRRVKSEEYLLDSASCTMDHAPTRTSFISGLSGQLIRGSPFKNSSARAAWPKRRCQSKQAPGAKGTVFEATNKEVLLKMPPLPTTRSRSTGAPCRHHRQTPTAPGFEGSRRPEKHKFWKHF